MVTKKGLAAAVAAVTVGGIGWWWIGSSSDRPSAPMAAAGPDARDGASGQGAPPVVKAQRLRPGEKPPQFVVFSWDGAGEDDNQLFSHFRAVGKEVGATQTFFLTGLYLLPKSKSNLYRPPGHPRGSSAIPWLSDKSVLRTLRQVRGAYQDGNEIGTHFNGHFCGPGGVGSWSPSQWRSEITQAKWFVRNWRTTTGWTNEPPLPFDYDKELIGGRTPCLEGGSAMRKAARTMGFRYDSSGTGTQVWPHKSDGMWELPLQAVPFPGRNFEVLSMDYNFLANQSRGYQGDPSRRPYWGRQVRDGLLHGFDRAYNGNRAPFIVGNHLEDWNGGVYMSAVEDFMRSICRRPQTRCVSFRTLVDWLDAQDPRVLAQLRKLDVGEEPSTGWPGAGSTTIAAPAH
ncbi:hypothetical protein [Actinomadura rupiterrae]|uniref:hypothetical protein n=1 Tax=Actinomadura rupiterrae TaxID=559627 RepID=UPI0020A60991|nr:hypothetical protein [Actinomadura rupiterrae]MCP2341975.1 hypothetical protein [Actinomadura rupiterrae]